MARQLAGRWVGCSCRVHTYSRGSGLGVELLNTFVTGLDLEEGMAGTTSTGTSGTQGAVQGVVSFQLLGRRSGRLERQQLGRVSSTAGESVEEGSTSTFSRSNLNSDVGWW